MLRSRLVRIGLALFACLSVPAALAEQLILLRDDPPSGERLVAVWWAHRASYLAMLTGGTGLALLFWTRRVRNPDVLESVALRAAVRRSKGE